MWFYLLFKTNKIFRKFCIYLCIILNLPSYCIMLYLTFLHSFCDISFSWAQNFTLSMSLVLFSPCPPLNFLLFSGTHHTILVLLLHLSCFFLSPNPMGMAFQESSCLAACPMGIDSFQEVLVTRHLPITMLTDMRGSATGAPY